MVKATDFGGRLHHCFASSREQQLRCLVETAFDAANRLTSLVDAVGTHSFTWGALAGEDGPWAQDTVSYAYNDSLLRQSLTLLQPNASAWTQSYGHDGNWRLQTLTSPAGAFGYQYRGSSSLVTNLSLPNTAAITNEFDGLGRLLSTVLRNSSGTWLDQHGYQCDAAHQRTQQTLLDGNTWDYGYDALGQLTSAQGKESGGTSRLQEQLSYGYDAAGNLTNRVNNGFSQTFTLNNSYNQLSSAARTNGFTVAGLVQTSTNVFAVTVIANGDGG